MKRPSKLGELLQSPTREKKKDFLFHLPVAVHKAFQRACKKRGRPMSQVITAFMIDFAAGKYDGPDD